MLQLFGLVGLFFNYRFRYYHGSDQVNRLLQMIANLVVFKAREIVGEAFIDDPEVCRIVSF